jgi:hypothetical protein
MKDGKRRVSSVYLALDLIGLHLIAERVEQLFLLVDAKINILKRDGDYPLLLDIRLIGITSVVVMRA